MATLLRKEKLNDPHYIVFEGLNGGGKSTLIKKLLHALQTKNKKAISIREPGETNLGKRLRGIIQEGEVGKISPLSELFLFQADRAQTFETIVIPSLADGSYVIGDRSFYSSIAFQGAGRNLSLEDVTRTSHIAVQNRLPDLVILVDIPPLVGLQRAKNDRNNGKDSFESEEVSFHNAVREKFLELSKTEKNPWLILNGEKSEDEVWHDLLSILSGVIL